MPKKQEQKRDLAVKTAFVGSEDVPEGKKNALKNFKRRKSDYAWLAAFFVIYAVVGELMPGGTRSTPADQQFVKAACNPFGFEDETRIWAVAGLITIGGLIFFTQALWFIMKAWKPQYLPFEFYSEQMRAISVNMVLLGLVQTLWDWITVNYPIAKVKADRLDAQSIVTDSLLWMATFELAWYTQHRLMHDVKFLWTYGHAYHHTWRRPAHMIGITNFAFDHVVEVVSQFVRSIQPFRSG